MPATQRNTAAAQAASLRLLRGSLRVLSRVAPRTASRLAVEMFRRPRRFAAPPREKELMAGAERLTIAVGSRTRIAAWRWGDGPVVVLAHGWEGRGSQMASFTAPLVAAGFSVVTFDAIAHGESSGKRSSLPHFTWALRRVAAATGEPHAVIAHSLGCAAATLALRDGLPARKAIFIAPPLNPADYTRQFGAILGLTDAVVEDMKLRVEERFLRLWSDYSLAQAAPSMRTPLLIVHDTDDDDTPWSGGSALAGLWPDARLITTTGLGHRRVLRDPAIVEAVVSFIAQEGQQPR